MSQELNKDFEKLYQSIKPKNKILNILILGGGPIGLFAGYKLLKKGNIITIFEKRKKYTRHNILSLKEGSKLDTLSLIPSEIIEELDHTSSFSHYSNYMYGDNKKCHKNIIREKPYLMVPSRNYYIVLNELESAYEKYFKLGGGKLIRPENMDAFTNIRIENDFLKYSENGINYDISLPEFDIIFLNDGANSYYRNLFFDKTSYTKNIENNILRYELSPNDKQICLSENSQNSAPLAYGLIFIYNIENKEEFQEKFQTEDKLKKKADFDFVLGLENKDDNLMKGLTIKEILIENSSNNCCPKQLLTQNLFRMFVSQNYLYISIMVNPRDVGDFSQKLQGQNLVFDDLPKNLQTYITFVLYIYDLSELIDPRSKNNNIKLFPLNFYCVKQSCSFVKKNELSKNNNPARNTWLTRKDSHAGIIIDQSLANTNCDTPHIKNNYQFITLCGDAMASGNFHAGIVLNMNLVAVSRMCQLMDDYIDAYPKDSNGNLHSNFLRLLFFHGNILNQRVRNEIITKSIDALINYDALDKDDSVFDLPQILLELNDIIVCQNCNNKNKLMCKNSAAFVKFMVENSNDEVLQRILKYLLLPDKYKYNKQLDDIIHLEPLEEIFA